MRCFFTHAERVVEVSPIRDLARRAWFGRRGRQSRESLSRALRTVRRKITAMPLTTVSAIWITPDF